MHHCEAVSGITPPPRREMKPAISFSLLARPSHFILSSARGRFESNLFASHPGEVLWDCTQ